MIRANSSNERELNSTECKTAEQAVEMEVPMSERIKTAIIFVSNCISEIYYTCVIWFERITKLRWMEMTAKGECLKEYCRKITDGTLDERHLIAAYESEIEAVKAALYEECNEELTREETALALWKLFSMVGSQE